MQLAVKNIFETMDNQPRVMSNELWVADGTKMEGDLYQ